MAIVLIEGFDHFTKDEVAEKFWTGSPAGMGAGRLPGSQAMDVILDNEVSKNLPSSYSTLVAGAAIRVNELESNFMSLWAGTAVVTIGISGGRLLVTDNAGRTFAGTTSVPINSWFYVEIKVTVGTSGTFELHLNGAVEIASTTANFGTSNISLIRFEYGRLGGGSTSVDDVYVLDTTGSAPRNDFLGDVAVRTLYPDGDGTYSQWTPSPSGPHHDDVDDLQIDGDGSFIYDSTPGDKDSFSMTSLPVSTVYAAQLNLGARKGDAGTTRQIEPLIRQAGVDHVGPTFTLSAAYLFYSWLLNQDPTGTDWTGATINADEYGVELVA